VRPAWEYATLICMANPGRGTEYRAWLRLPGQPQQEVEDQDGVLTRLGSDGWELVGPPNVFNAAIRINTAAGTWYDRACWAEMWFYFKRMVVE
jgi:hypothetical protein